MMQQTAHVNPVHRVSPRFWTGELWYRVLVWAVFTAVAAAAIYLTLYIASVVLFVISEMAR